MAAGDPNVPARLVQLSDDWSANHAGAADDQDLLAPIVAGIAVMCVAYLSPSAWTYGPPSSRRSLQQLS
jgi:hypothetical protein